MKLNIITKTSAYVQIAQTSELEFALIKRDGPKEFSELHYKVKCRDYFGDALLSAMWDIDQQTVYGFNLREKRISLDEALLSLHFKSEETVNTFWKNRKVLWFIEKKIGIPKTLFYRTQEAKAIIAIGDKYWLKSPLLFSLYTLLIRGLTYSTGSGTLLHYKKIVTDYPGQDANLLGKILGSINLFHFLDNIDKVLGYVPETGIVDHKDTIKDVGDYGKTVLYTLTSKTYTKEYARSWSWGEHHNYHGIATFIDNYALLKSHNKDLVSTFSVDINRNCMKWAWNYYNLEE